MIASSLIGVYWVSLLYSFLIGYYFGVIFGFTAWVCLV